jgi:hypothetical protein
MYHVRRMGSVHQVVTDKGGEVESNHKKSRDALKRMQELNLAELRKEVKE